MSAVSFADVVHQSISFSRSVPAHALVLDLIDCAWVQRLRDICQTANTRLVYMFSEHSRFGHCLGVAYLANVLMDKLSSTQGDLVEPYRKAVSAAAVLHDIGHLAPGSHTAWKTWFPNASDGHEQVAARIIHEDPELRALLATHSDSDAALGKQITSILSEAPSLPAWTWEIISGGGWNVDRGNWCVVDSIMAGVSYGRYNIPALTDSILITDDGHLAIQENRLDAMMHFALSRHAMYRQIYQHRVLLAADTLNHSIVRRARDIGEAICFADDTMRTLLAAKTPESLPLPVVFQMRESWWRYHLGRWAQGKDSILADLSTRLLNRRLFKTVRMQDHEDPQELQEQADHAVRAAGFDPRYYLHQVSTRDMHQSDYKKSLLVQLDDGSIKALNQAEPLFEALVRESKQLRKSWLVLPAEAKLAWGRTR
jgi:HD superfamily phosphohydrolase